jgi:hypothetical protein
MTGTSACLSQVSTDMGLMSPCGGAMSTDIVSPPACSRGMSTDSGAMPAYRGMMSACRGTTSTDIGSMSAYRRMASTDTQMPPAYLGPVSSDIGSLSAHTRPRPTEPPQAVGRGDQLTLSSCPSSRAWGSASLRDLRYPGREIAGGRHRCRLQAHRGSVSPTGISPPEVSVVELAAVAHPPPANGISIEQRSRTSPWFCSTCVYPRPSRNRGWTPDLPRREGHG